jgi:phage baseplate assembly protein gpV
MSEGLVETAAHGEERDQGKVYGVALATVIDNVDLTGEARVQLRLPWLPGFDPWARVAVPMAGLARGTFFIPQIGDEVVVAFNGGDVRDPLVIGSVWNMIDRPPALLPTDAINKRLIRTPFGQELEFDELLQSVTIKNTTFQTMTLDPLAIEVATTGGLASVRLGTDGSVSITAATRIELKAPSISIEGGVVEIKSAGAATTTAGGTYTVKAPLVTIN